MRALHPLRAAGAAVTAHESRPAAAILHDAPDARTDEALLLLATITPRPGSR